MSSSLEDVAESSRTSSRNEAAGEEQEQLQGACSKQHAASKQAARRQAAHEERIVHGGEISRVVGCMVFADTIQPEVELSTGVHHGHVVPLAETIKPNLTSASNSEGMAPLASEPVDDTPRSSRRS